MTFALPTGCDTCGQVDDHPKLHYGVETFHHDCVPARVRREIGEHQMLDQIIAAASSGVRGSDLRAHIADLHQEG